MDDQRIREMAAAMRRKILDISLACNTSVHLGGGLSMVDILATLYGRVLHFDPNNPTWEDRDRFILSKGHGVLGFFSALVVSGIISEAEFGTFMTNGSHLIAHPVMNLSLGIESSNGSLGQGLSMGIGLALAALKKEKSHKIYVMLGNGECNDGSVWEAAISAAHYKLKNLTAIIDHNGLQSDGRSEIVMDFGDFADKWKSFGWDVHLIDGHDLSAIHAALVHPNRGDRPKAIIAQTIKGKGVSFMENANEWHHNRLTKANHEKALLEMEGQ